MCNLVVASKEGEQDIITHIKDLYQFKETDLKTLNSEPYQIVSGQPMIVYRVLIKNKRERGEEGSSQGRFHG